MTVFFYNVTKVLVDVREYVMTFCILFCKALKYLLMFKSVKTAKLASTPDGQILLHTNNSAQTGTKPATFCQMCCLF